MANEAEKGGTVHPGSGAPSGQSHIAITFPQWRVLILREYQSNTSGMELLCKVAPLQLQFYDRIVACKIVIVKIYAFILNLSIVNFLAHIS